ncbi:hypothetical protein L9F63_001634 [Diploptera punctata]|uniref:Vanin C-terminal domain-containing protein n=1 Tax=Diploptera punctata TaxID=6984 RepID=A0AAD8A3L4_DIPPU|nr:hypothetical protein L9F63_001634 [Diploptera punctata]
MIPPSYKQGAVKTNGYLYRLAVFDGTKTRRGMVTYGGQICGVMACTGTSLSTCGLVMDMGKTQTIRTVFERVGINASFPLDYTNQMPTALDEKLKLLPVRSYKFVKRDIVSSNVARISMYTTTNVSLYAFGIFGRQFERDDLPATTQEFPED